MHIIWHGQSCFQILVNQNKNNSISIVIDPFDKTIGLKVPSLKADLLFITHNHYDHNNIAAVKGLSSKILEKTGRTSPFLINGAGEYDIKGVYVQGITAFHDNVEGKERGKITFYIIEAEGITLCHLGDLGQKNLTTEQIEKIGMIDILMIPVGGIYTIDGEQANNIIKQIEPKIVIPMHYFLPGLKIKLNSLDKFLKIVGQKTIETQKKLLIKKKDLSQEKTEIIILEP